MELQSNGCPFQTPVYGLCGAKSTLSFLMESLNHTFSRWPLSDSLEKMLKDEADPPQIYFVADAETLARGEFDSMLRLASVIPNNVAKVVAHGLCANNPSRAFILSEWKEMTDNLPGVDELVAVVHKIHQAVSPTGKFGSPGPTCTGEMLIPVGMYDTWEEYFTLLMKQTMEAELGKHGPDPELEQLSPKILSKVIPRRICPMETEGRSIKPVLLHGDLWHGNVSIDNETKVPILYDPACFYGHAECETNSISSLPHYYSTVLSFLPL